MIFLTLILIIYFGCDSEDKPEPLTNEQLEIFNYLPQQSEFILFMNLNQLRHTDLWDNYFKKSLDSYQQQKWLSEFESATGVGINNGVAEVYLATSWAGNNEFIIRFDKNYEGIKNYFDSSYSSYLSNSKKIFYKADNPLAEFYLVNQSVLIVANNRDFISSISSDEFYSIKKNNVMMSAINNIRKKKYYWMATDKVSSYASALVEQLFNLGGNEDAKKMFHSIKSISLSASFEEGALLQSSLQLSNEKDAFLFSIAIRSAISNKLPDNFDERLKEIIKKIEVNRDKDEVSITLFIDQTDLLELQKLSKQTNE